MEKYDHKSIEKKWQAAWETAGMYRGDENSTQPKKYILDMFPYPSGDGLHLGHIENYTATCVYSRYMRAKGFNVMHPIGWDAFGLPAENYAIKTGTHPDISAHQNITNFIVQMKAMGFSSDWSREIDTSLPEYYRWTQWFFLLLYKNGLAYKKKAKVNWCESCKTVLANEQAENGVCERCKNEVIQKDLEQWFFKITDYADDLINDLSKVDWPSSTVAAQRHWIGRSEGVEFKMAIDGTSEFISVYTTRIDTVFGMTYVVLAPEHPLIETLSPYIKNKKEVDEYVQATEKKTELERTELGKEKTGVQLEAVFAINPFTKNKIPVFVADYVLWNYGTGAVMAVPAHDERDLEFAKKYGLQIKEVIAEISGEKKDGDRSRDRVCAVIEKDGKILCEELNEDGTKFAGKYILIGGGIEDGESPEETLVREMSEEIGITDIKTISKIGTFRTNWFCDRKNNHNGPWTMLHHAFSISIDFSKIKENPQEAKLIWVDIREAISYFKEVGNICQAKILERHLDNKNSFYSDYGELVSSGDFSGLSSGDARVKMTEWLRKNNIGIKKVNYRLRDWLVSRQRYWGAPIPIIYCEEHGEVPVPEKDLPVLLPTDVDFRPTGESPLKYSKTFNDVVCPTCGKAATREADTMDTFVCSSWYYFRFADPHNEKEFASKEATEKWLPVDMYMGGAEHTVLHLMYARFFTKVLKKLGYINFDEPFTKLRHQGIILAEDGRKMSKSLGNVISPNSLVETYGADTLRLHEMFLGPLEDMKAWNSQTIIGPRRFLERVWRLKEKVAKEKDINEVEAILHKTIKKVGEDIERFGFNTAISSLMILANSMEKCEAVSRGSYETLLILLAPFAPHITEELWHKLGNNESINLASWPTFDATKCIESEITIAIQVNGKVRDTIVVHASIDNSALEKMVLARSLVEKWINGKSVKKIVVVKGRLVSIVVAD